MYLHCKSNETKIQKIVAESDFVIRELNPSLFSIISVFAELARVWGSPRAPFLDFGNLRMYLTPTNTWT